MAHAKQECPRCGLYSLRCIRSIPTGVDGHPLESPRLSVWECQNDDCRARFQLEQTGGKLRPLQMRAG